MFNNDRNELEGSRCLVVGGNGFIGRQVVTELIGLGATVTSLDLLIPEKRVNGVEYIEMDITKKIPMTMQFDYVFNLSGFVDHSPFEKGGRQMIDVHYVGLLNLIDSLDHKQLKGFVQIGSSDEYGNQPSPQVETMRESPISCYSAAKASASHLMQMLAKQENFPGTVLRFFLVYGPGQNAQRFLPQVIQGCLEDKLFPTSSGEQLRDFCYIDDIVRAILAAANPSVHGEIFNIASGKPVTIESVIKKVEVLIGTGKALVGEIAYRPGENMSLYADISKAESVLDWRPEVSLEDGLSKTIEYYKMEYELL